MSTKVITDVPPGKVATYTALFKSAGATSVTPVNQTDGNVTLIVVYPDTDALDKALALPGGG